MGRAIKWLISIAAALVGSIMGEILAAQRGEHPQGDVLIAPSPAQIAPCLIVIGLVARATRGNLAAMAMGSLLAGVISGLGFGAKMAREIRREADGK